MMMMMMLEVVRDVTLFPIMEDHDAHFSFFFSTHTVRGLQFMTIIKTFLQVYISSIRGPRNLAYLKENESFLLEGP